MTFSRHMFSRVVGLSALCLAALIAHGQELEKATTKGGVSIQFPAGWVVVGAAQLPAAAASGADKDGTGTYQATLAISQEAGGKADATGRQTAMAKQLQGYKVIEPPTNCNFAGLQGVYIGGTFKNPNANGQLRSRQYIFNVNNQIYVVNFTCLESMWKSYQPLLESSIATLSIKK